ncbi:MAG TPA: DUF2169 domain-containing protein [Polyangium sp.]|nr:DUF2169 domain-containing protein [Polyangium sp.]
MRKVSSSCPLRVASVVWQPAEGLFMLTVITKATFDLRPEESPLAENQDEPTAHDEYWNDDENASLRAASDILPFKKSADVVVVGYAYAPQVLSDWPFHTRLVVGKGIDKIIEIHGERRWTKEDQLIQTPCAPRVPLRWERAAGGPGTSNPVGMLPVTRLEAGQARKLPNLEPRHTRSSRPTDVIPTIGFGPIAPSWPERKSLIDAREGEWDPSLWHEKPLAPYVDASFFQVAPADQRLERMTGDERIQLENLHPEYSRFSTRLNAGRPYGIAQKPGKNPIELELRCDTLVIDTERCVATLTWRGSIPLAYPEELVEVEVTTDKKRRMRPPQTNSSSTVVLDLDEPSGVIAAPALPFAVQQVLNRQRLDPASVSLERYATIGAELNEGQQTRFRILETHVLTSDDWTAIEAYWKKALDEEGASGKHELRKKYDDAYLARVEKFRGPITPEERRKIMASLDRRKTLETLDQLKIQRAALMPILRSVARQAIGIDSTSP